LFVAVLAVLMLSASLAFAQTEPIVNMGCSPAIILVVSAINDRAGQVAYQRGTVPGRITTMVCMNGEAGGVIRQPSGKHVPFKVDEGSEVIFRKMQGQ
jgi:hypothetical protein